MKAPNGDNARTVLTCIQFRSPQLLMVSGIGPRSALAAHGIPVIADRPGVGQNLWDHALFGPSYRVNVLTHSILTNNATYAAAAAQSFNAHPPTGILTNTGGDYLAFEKLLPSQRAHLSASAQRDLAAFPADWPDVEYLFLDAWAGLQENYVDGAPKDGFNYVSAVSALVAPLSRGNVTIRSADTAVPPLVDPAWLSHPTDRELAVLAFRRARAIFASAAMQPVVLGAEAFPGANYTTDAEILDVIRRSLITVYHASATNAMGRREDARAVVDARCRVLGVAGLRVVDASAFPFLPPGHPQATVCELGPACVRVKWLANGGEMRWRRRLRRRCCKGSEGRGGRAEAGVAELLGDVVFFCSFPVQRPLVRLIRLWL